MARRAAPALGAGALVVVITLLAGIIRFAGLGAQPLWLDEGATVYFARMSPQRLWLGIPWETNPPLYYSLQRIWFVFGQSDFALRSLPALIGTLTVPLTGYLGRVVAGPRAGVLAAAMLALCGVHVQYSQEARAYSLVIAALVIATLALARLLAREPDRHGAGRGELLDWSLYAAAALVALYSHNTAVLPLLLLNVAASGWWLGTGARNRRLAAAWLQANALVVAAYLWWLPLVMEQSVHRLRDWWVPERGVAEAIGITRAVSGFPFLGSAQPWADLFVVLTAVAGGACLLRRRAAPALLLVALVVGVPVLTWLFSVWRPIYMPRVLLWSLPAMVVLTAAGATAWRSRAAAGVLVLSLLLLRATDLALYFGEYRKEPWDRMMAAVAAHAAPGDVLVVSPGYPAMRLLAARYLAHGASLPVHGWRSAGPPPAGKRYWLLQREEGRLSARQVARVLGGGVQPILHQEFAPGGFVLELYDPGGEQR